VLVPNITSIYLVDLHLCLFFGKLICFRKVHLIDTFYLHTVLNSFHTNYYRASTGTRGETIYSDNC
jgi:hypothetical protein